MVEYLYSHLPPVRFAGKKLVGRVVFSLLIVAAAVIGALTGLMIVYSTDLPQVSELERYRPSATTELYDDKGKIVGTFALRDRPVAVLLALTIIYFLCIGAGSGGGWGRFRVPVEPFYALCAATGGAAVLQRLRRRAA